VRNKELQVRFEQAADPETGWAFTLLSLSDDHLVLPYFHREMWSSDDRWLLCERQNVRLTYLCNWREGQAEVLDLAWNGAVHHACYGRTADKIWFTRGREIWQGTPGGPAERVHTLQTEGRISELSPNGSDSGFALMLSVADLFKRLVYVDLGSGEETICREGNRQLGHLQMCPTRDDLIMFADQHDAANWQRIYTVLTNGREHFPFYAQRKGEWVTHECWTRDGEHVTFTRHPEGLCIVDANGENVRLVRAGNYWHCQGGRSGELIAADLWHGEVHLIRGADGAFQALTEAWTEGGKWIPQGPLHSHPCLSQQEQSVAHVDGRTGLARVRVYDLGPLCW